MSSWPRPEPPAPSPRQHASAVQALHLIAGGVILFLLGGGALAATAVRHDRQPAGGDIAVPVGPGRATSLERYVADRNAELLAFKGRSVSVISFRAYVSEAEARVLVAPANVKRWLVAAPGTEPDVTGDVGQWSAGVVRTAQEEIAEFERLIPTLGQDPEFERQSRLDLETDRKLLAAVQSGTPLVFGVVIEADARVLRTIAGRPGVRLVDLAAQAAARAADVRGLRPEESVAAGDPKERPAP